MGIGQLLLKLSLVVGWYTFFETQCIYMYMYMKCNFLLLAYYALIYITLLELFATALTVTITHQSIE